MALSTDGTNAAQMYRSAARMIEREQRVDFACEAICLADPKFCAGNDSWEKHPLGVRMKRVFAPRSPQYAWLEVDGLREKDATQRSVRILALCFMAAMVEAGDA